MALLTASEEDQETVGLKRANVVTSPICSIICFWFCGKFIWKTWATAKEILSRKEISSIDP